MVFELWVVRERWFGVFDCCLFGVFYFFCGIGCCKFFIMVEIVVILFINLYEGGGFRENMVM